MGHNGLTPPSSKDEAGFGLTGIVISLLLVALLSVGALKAFAGGATTGSGSGALNATVAQAYDVQAQTALSTAMQNVRDGAISSGSMSDAGLAQYGVATGPSGSASVVSGAVAASTAPVGGDGALGFGSVTLAAKSKSGTCWFVWFSASTTWYGSEPKATSCVASSVAATPTAGAGSAGLIGWQEGSFPTV